MGEITVNCSLEKEAPLLCGKARQKLLKRDLMWKRAERVERPFLMVLRCEEPLISEASVIRLL